MLYLAISIEAVSVVFIRKENGEQLPVYYISNAISLAKSQYPGVKKLYFSLMIASRKFRLYFQAHSIQVLTNFPLK